MKPMPEMYYLFLHPKQVEVLLEGMSPKEKWKMEYRMERMKKKGKFVLHNYAKIGAFNGMRFIENDT